MVSSEANLYHFFSSELTLRILDMVWSEISCDLHMKNGQKNG